MIKTSLIVLFMVATGASAQVGSAAATPATDSLATFARRVQEAYEKSTYLSFHVRYLYANVSQPNRYLDSVRGTVEMDRGRSRIMLDGMETVFTDKYAIHILKDDKVIYVSAPHHGLDQNPVGMLDSILTQV